MISSSWKLYQYLDRLSSKSSCMVDDMTFMERMH